MTHPYKGCEPADNVTGYHLIVGRRHSGKKHLLVHRLVAELFIGPPPFAEAVVNHKNGVKHDNRVENLEWTTNSGNTLHYWSLVKSGQLARNGKRGGWPKGRKRKPKE